MNQAVSAKIIRRLLAVYGRPNGPDPETLFEEFDKALSGFSSAIFDDAVDAVIRTHRFQCWPTVADVVFQCNAMAARLEDNRQRDLRQKAIAYQPEPVNHATAEAVSNIVSQCAKGMDNNNSFVDIVQRCPIGGTIDVSAPWGQEVKDRYGHVIPIRPKKNAAHASDHWSNAAR